MRRTALQKDLFGGKLKPDNVKKMGYTDDQIREIVSGRRMLPGESWGSVAPACRKSRSWARANRAERKKRGEAGKSAQEFYMRAVEERKKRRDSSSLTFRSNASIFSGVVSIERRTTSSAIPLPLGFRTGWFR